MRRITRYLSMLLAVAVCATACEDYVPSDMIEAPMSLKLKGSYERYDNTLFSGEYEVFKNHRHSRFVHFIDGGFALQICRELKNESLNQTVDIDIAIEHERTPLQLGRVYSLKMLSESRATITTHNGISYTATDGYIIIEQLVVDQSDYLLSGKFRFQAKSSDGDTIEVNEGVFANSRAIVQQR